MKSYIGKSLLKLEVEELVTRRGHIPQWGIYENSKQEYLTIDGVKVAKFNYNCDGFYTYTFNKECYTDKQFKHLQEYCPVGAKYNAKFNIKGWYRGNNGYYGRMMGRNGYTITKDLHFILDHITFYLINIEELF